MINWIGMPAHNRWLEGELDRILEFGRASRVENGFGWLSNDGGIIEEQGTHLWVTARMLHVYSVAALMGRPGGRSMAIHGVRALTEGVLRDKKYGGWYAVVANEGDEIRARKKEVYAHFFVALAAAGAVAAEVPGANELLAIAIDVIDQRFWSETESMVLDDWDETFTTLEDYRGGNASLHALEAFLILHDVTGNDVWLERALSIVGFVIHKVARNNDYRVNEHFDSKWTPLFDYNKDAPGDQFRAYGGTPGHWVEWGRLMVQMRATFQAEGKDVPEWLLEDAEGLFAAGVRDAWNTDGQPGMVYSVDWEGRPVVRSRMGWVLMEAIGSAYALHLATGKKEYLGYYQEFWDYCRDFLMDYETGSWWQELDQNNRPTSIVWDGKEDTYHLLHCLVIPRLPLTPGLAPALAAGLLDHSSQP